MHRQDRHDASVVAGPELPSRPVRVATTTERLHSGTPSGEVVVQGGAARHAGVLRLQRLAGNGATAALLAERPPGSPVAQRQIAYTPEMLKKSGGRAHLFRSSDYKAVAKALVAYHREPKSPRAPMLLAALVAACDRWLASKGRSASSEKDLAIVAIRAQATTELGTLQVPAARPAVAAPPRAEVAAPAAVRPSLPASGFYDSPAPASTSGYYDSPAPVPAPTNGPAPAAGFYNDPAPPAWGHYVVPGRPPAASPPAATAATAATGSSDYATGLAPVPQPTGTALPAMRPAPPSPAQAPFDPNKYRIDPDSLEPEAIMASFRGAFGDFAETPMQHGGEDWAAFHAAPDPDAGPKLAPQSWVGGRGHIRGLTPTDRPDYELNVQSDKVFYWGRDKKAYDTSQMKSLLATATFGRAIFIMTRDGQVYAADMTAEYAMGDVPPAEREKWIFHHSSFLGGQPVASAGEVRFLNGRLVSVSDGSGHYRPTDRFTVQFLQHLRSAGVDISTVSVEITNLARHSNLPLPMVPATVLCDFQGDTEAIVQFLDKGGNAAIDQEERKASMRGGAAGAFESAFWTEAKLSMSIGAGPAGFLVASQKYWSAGSSWDGARMLLKALAVAPEESTVREILALTMPSGSTVLAEFGRDLRALKNVNQGFTGEYDYATARVRTLWQIVDQLAPA